MEVGSQHVVNEFLLLVPVFGASCLVLEDHIVVPSALHGEVFRIEQGIASGDVDFALFFLFCGAFCLLLGFGCSALFLDLLKFAHKGRGFVLFVFVPGTLLARG